MIPIADRFVMFLPDGYAINPYSKKNWEKTGVIPDIQVPAKEALAKAVGLLQQHSNAADR